MPSAWRRLEGWLGFVKFSPELRVGARAESVFWLDERVVERRSQGQSSEGGEARHPKDDPVIILSLSDF